VLLQPVDLPSARWDLKSPALVHLRQDLKAMCSRDNVDIQQIIYFDVNATSCEYSGSVKKRKRKFLMKGGVVVSRAIKVFSIFFPAV